MCLILFAYQAHPEYELIVCANRDEFFARPTAAAHFWEDVPQILAGRDLEKMGTWMGVSKTGRFAAVTNYRDPKEQTIGKKSRGDLVADFLKNQQRSKDYIEHIAANLYDYPGYNLLVFDGQQLYYYSNVEGKPKLLGPGIYGVSNHLLNSNWPKVQQGKQSLAEIVTEPDRDLKKRLFSMLQNTDVAPDEDLPETGVSLERERFLSPMFIKDNEYGTRSSTLLLMTGKEINFIEQNHLGESQDFKIVIHS